MLDLKFVRENPDIVKKNIQNKFQEDMKIWSQEIDHLVKCLLCSHEDVSSDPEDPYTKPSVGIHTCNPRREGVETGGLFAVATLAEKT